MNAAPDRNQASLPVGATITGAENAARNPLVISVVVPTYRRPDMLERCLRALLAQRFAPTAFEVIVADDGPDEATRALVESLGHAADNGPSLRYVPVVGTQGPSGARNRGWETARAGIIAFTDDDTLPDQDWLARGASAMTEDVSAVVGRIIVPLPARPLDYELDASGLERAEFATANCFIRKSALIDVGGFDERFTMAWREDSDMQFMLMAHGYRIARADDAVVVHPVRPAPQGVSVAQQRKVFFDALLYKKHPGFYRERIRRRPPWNYFVIVAGLLAIVIGLSADMPDLAWTGLAAWTILTLEFCLRRLIHTSRAPRHVIEMLVTSILIPPLAVFWRLRGAWHFKTRFL